MCSGAKENASTKMGCDADEILDTKSIFVKINYTRRRRHLRASADMTGAIHLYD
jgi:hypothetical protein